MKLREKWKNDCMKVLDPKCWPDLDTASLFQLWNTARVCRALLKSIEQFDKEEEK